MSAGLSKFESTRKYCTLSNMPCCKAVIRNLVFRIVCRIQSSDNVLVKAVRSSSVNQTVLEEDAICSFTITLYAGTLAVCV